MGIGSVLREARMREGIDITDVESETKIRTKFLRALENEEWEMVGDDTLVKSFLRTYAQHLGLDPRPLVEDFTLGRSSEQSAIGPLPTGLRGRTEQASPFLLRAALALGLLAAAVLLVLVGTGRT
ncbi:MAG: helix-turn-helix transcriptional regulator [Actinomycetes bacterium]